MIMSDAITHHLEGLILGHVEHGAVRRDVVHADAVWVRLELGRGQDLRAIANLGYLICNSVCIPLLVLLLLYDVLKDAMASTSRHGHIPILLEFGVVALRLLRNTVSEEATGEALIVVLHGEHFEEATKVVQLVDPTIIYLPRELLTPHLIPE